MSEVKFMRACDVCDRQYQFGPHIYDGHVIKLYRITVCSGCFEGNWDGWAPQYEKRVTANLDAAGEPLPPRNAKGWLPRD